MATWWATEAQAEWEGMLWGRLFSPLWKALVKIPSFMPPETPVGVPQEHHTEYWAHLGAIILCEMTGLEKTTWFVHIPSCHWSCCFNGLISSLCIGAYIGGWAAQLFIVFHGQRGDDNNNRNNNNSQYSPKAYHMPDSVPSTLNRLLYSQNSS